MVNQGEEITRQSIMDMAEQAERHFFNEQIHRNRVHALVGVCLKQHEAMESLKARVKELESQIAAKESA